MKVIHVVGARPNFMKAAPILRAVERHNRSGEGPRIEQLLVHTGQHYDRAMSQDFFDDLGLPEPDLNLGVGSGSHAEQTGQVMVAFERLLLKDRCDLVIVVGDVNSTMACAIAAKKLGIAVAHVEAGLRSRDMGMPEEINRKVTDAIADYLFTTDRGADQNLLAEGVRPEQIFFVGNVMIDSLLAHREAAARSTILEKLGLLGANGVEPYAVLTLHRPSNVDDAATLRGICEAIATISKRLRVVFPCHPRTAERLEAFGLAGFFGAAGERVIRTEPLGYLDFLRLDADAKVILTDSGGIQEESTILGIPCVTLRDNTERPITIEQGTNRLCGNARDAILKACDEALTDASASARTPEKWDGRAAERIAAVLVELAREVQRAP
jgi:UDP-N-acetylglucosamine 2-epimerase (non-hydrolysing)